MPAPVAAVLGRTAASAAAGATRAAATTGARAAATASARTAGARAAGMGRAASRAASRSAAAPIVNAGRSSSVSSAAAGANEAVTRTAGEAMRQAASPPPSTVASQAAQASSQAGHAADSVNSLSSNVHGLFNRVSQLLTRSTTSNTLADNRTQGSLQRLTDVVTQVFSGGAPPAAPESGGGALPPGYDGGGFSGGGGGDGGGSGGGFGGMFGGGGGGRRQTIGGLFAAAQGGLGRQFLTGGLGNPVGIMRMGVEVAKMPARLRDFGEELLASQRHLAGFSGTMAGAVLELRADRIRRDIQRARETGGTFRSLTQSQSSLESRLLKYQVGAQNSLNIIAGKTLAGIEGILGVIERLTVLDEIAGMLGKMGDDSSESNAFVKSYMRGILKNTDGDGRELPPIGRG